MAEWNQMEIFKILKQYSYLGMPLKCNWFAPWSSINKKTWMGESNFASWNCCVMLLVSNNFCKLIFGRFSCEKVRAKFNRD